MWVIDEKKIKAILFERCMTITELARRADISLVTAMRTVNSRTAPRAGTVKKICSVLNCSPYDITKEVNE